MTLEQWKSISTGRLHLLGSKRSLVTTAWMFAFLILSGCSGGSGGIGGDASPSGGLSIATWGDSTTSGIGAIAGQSYPEQLQSITGRVVFNGGVSGQTSDQIAARAGGSPALLTFPDNTVPGSGPVTVAAQSTFLVTEEGPGPITGTIGALHGTLSYQSGSNPVLVFARDDSGSAVSIPAQSPFLPDTFGREAYINVFWMGQSNFYETSQILADIANSIGFLTTQKFIVLSILNAQNEGVGTAPYNAIMQLNAQLARTYPNNYLDIRQILVNRYDPGNAQDLRDYANDTAPESLRTDNDHLNERGYGIVAQEVADFINRQGW